MTWFRTWRIPVAIAIVSTLCPHANAQYGPPGPCCCPGDFDGNGVVDGVDVAILTAIFGPCPPGVACPADLNGDQVIDGADLAILNTLLGPCCAGDLDNNGVVDPNDATIFQTCWAGQSCPPDVCCAFDFNRDGLIDNADIAIVTTNFGLCLIGCPCPWDVDGDADVDLSDVTIVAASAGECCPGDMDNNRIITANDVNLLAALIGPCPPPPAICR